MHCHYWGSYFLDMPRPFPAGRASQRESGRTCWRRKGLAVLRVIVRLWQMWLGDPETPKAAPSCQVEQKVLKAEEEVSGETGRSWELGQSGSTKSWRLLLETSTPRVSHLPRLDPPTRFPRVDKGPDESKPKPEEAPSSQKGPEANQSPQNWHEIVGEANDRSDGAAAKPPGTGFQLRWGR